METYVYPGFLKKKGRNEFCGWFIFWYWLLLFQWSQVTGASLCTCMILLVNHVIVSEPSPSLYGRTSSWAGLANEVWANYARGPTGNGHYMAWPMLCAWPLAWGIWSVKVRLMVYVCWAGWASHKKCGQARWPKKKPYTRMCLFSWTKDVGLRGPTSCKRPTFDLVK